MAKQHLELQWLDNDETIDLAELSRACGLSPADLQELIDYGALAPVGEVQTALVFSARTINPLRTAGKLRSAYDLDLFAVALLMDYLHRIETLEAQLRSLQARTQ